MISVLITCFRVHLTFLWLFVRFGNVFCLRFSCFGWNFSAIAATAAAASAGVVVVSGDGVGVVGGVSGGGGGVSDVGGGGVGKGREG